MGWVRMMMEEDVGSFQAVGEHEGLVVEELDSGAVGHDAALVEKDGSRAELDGQFEVVSGDEFGAGQGLEEVFEFAAAARVESAGGFVQDEQVGLTGEQAGQAGAAFFTVAEVVGGAVGEVGHGDGGEGLFDAVPDFGFGQVELLGAEGDVLGDGGAEELVVRILEEQSDVLSDPWEVFRADVPAEDADLAVGPAVFGQDPVDVEEEGGFAGAVGAEQADAFARLNAQADTAEGFGAVVVAVVELMDFEGGVHDQPRANMAW
jgi:hypothetical protein